MMMHKTLLIATALFGAAVQAVNVDPEMEDMPMPHADYPVEGNNEILALVGKLNRKKEHKHRNLEQGHIPEDTDEKPMFRKVKIPSDEEGKRFLRKYCKRGKCNLPKKMRINNKRKAKKSRKSKKAKRCAKRNNVNKKRLTASEIEGVLAMQKVIERTRGKFGRNDRETDGEDKPIMHPWDEVDTRKTKMQKRKKERKARKISVDKEEPIMHPWNDDERKKSVKKQIVVVRRKTDKDNHPCFEVNQINLHVDVDVKQQQAQKEKQGVVQVGKINHRHRKHHGKKNYKRLSTKRGMILASMRQPTERVAQRHSKRPEKRKSEPDNGESKSKRSFLEDLKHKIKKGYKKMKKNLGIMRDRFEGEPTINQLAMVLALAAIITMQAMVLSKFLGMFDGYTPVPDNNDDDDDVLEVLEKGRARKTKSHSRTARMVQEKF